MVGFAVCLDVDLKFSIIAHLLCYLNCDKCARRSLSSSKRSQCDDSSVTRLDSFHRTELASLGVRTHLFLLLGSSLLFFWVFKNKVN